MNILKFYYVKKKSFSVEKSVETFPATSRLTFKNTNSAIKIIIKLNNKDKPEICIHKPRIEQKCSQ